MVGSVHAGGVVTAVSTAEAQLAVGEAPVAMGEVGSSAAEVPLALGPVPLPGWDRAARDRRRVASGTERRLKKIVSTNVSLWNNLSTEASDLPRYIQLGH